MKKTEIVSEKINLKLRPSTKRDLTIYCKKNNITISAYVRQLIENSLQKSKAK
jgi:predicted HicB family RNase H-like nuclease